MKITSFNAYLDGGTKSFVFDDGFKIYQDFRMFSPTQGKFFERYPSDSQEPINIIDEDRLRLIEGFDMQEYYKLK